jgi:small subunit ribosomal protein S4e
MVRGPRHHLKRLFAPKDWMLSKLTGVFAPRPRAGAHKTRECLPLLVVLRNRLKYALTAKEAQMITRQRYVRVDGRIRTDTKYPAGFMDVIEIPRSGERFRLLYDVKGRFSLVRIGEAEANIKICKVAKVWTTTGRVPMLTTSDGRRIRYPSLKIARGDSIVFDLKNSKITNVIKMRNGKIVAVTGGANRGRIGKIVRVERHPGSFDIAYLKDKNGNEFATRAKNVFVIGNSFDAIPITLPRQAGLKQNPVVEREERLIAAETRRQQIASRTHTGKKAKR